MSDEGEAAREVGLQVFDGFEADGDAQQTFTDASRCPGLRGDADA